MRRVLLVTLLTLGLAGTANAEFDYNFVQASYGQIDFDDLNADGDVFGISGSFAIAENYHVFGGFDFANLDSGVDATSFEAGFGYNRALTPVFDVVAQLSLQTVDVDTPAGGGDDSGFGLNVGGRYALSDMVELNGFITYVDLDDSGDGTGFAFAALFDVTSNATLGITAEFGDDADAFGILGRFYF